MIFNHLRSLDSPQSKRLKYILSPVLDLDHHNDPSVEFSTYDIWPTGILEVSLSIRDYSGNEILFIDVCFAYTTYTIICTLPAEPSTRESINKRATSVFVYRHVGRLYIYTDRGLKVSDLFIKCLVGFLASPPPPYRWCAGVPPLPRRRRCRLSLP